MKHADYVNDVLGALGDLLESAERLQYLGNGPSRKQAQALFEWVVDAVDELHAIGITEGTRAALWDRAEGIVACAPGRVK